MSVRRATRPWALLFGLAVLVGLAADVAAQTPPPPAFRTLPSPAPAGRVFDAEFSIQVSPGAIGILSSIQVSGSTMDVPFNRACGVLCPGPDVYRTFRFRMPALAAGTYTVRFKDGDTTVASFQMTVGGTPAPLPAGFHVAPTEGMWWSSEASGTGMAFSVDEEGRWFAALYLYESDGLPTFLTMQGDAIEYTRARMPEPYARARSRLIESRGGQCLGCPWRPFVSNYIDTQAEIVFFNRNRAELRVGDWKLRLTPLPEVLDAQSWPQEDHALLPHGRSNYILVTVRSALRNTTVVGRLEPPLTFPEPPPGPRPPGISYSFYCIDCEVKTDQGDASAEQVQALKRYLESFRLVCNPSVNPRCQILSNPSSSEFVVERVLVDKHKQQLILLDYGDGTRGDAKITIEALPADWAPTLPQ